MSIIHHIRSAAFLVLLCSILASRSYCYQKAVSDPNRDINSVSFTTNNPYYNSIKNGQRWLYGQCTWYVWGRCAETGWNISGNTGFAGNAIDFYDNVQGGKGKDLNPEVGAIMCLNLTAFGHVAVVVQVIDANSWVIDEYNINDGAPNTVQWSRETVTRDPANSTRVKGELFNWTTLKGFVHSPTGIGGSVDPANPYVDGSYSGTQIGTAANPFKTVAQAISAASATQATIHIKPGTYGEKVSTSKHILFVTWGTGAVKIGG